MTRAEFIAELDRLIVARIADAGQQRGRLVEDYEGLMRGNIWSAIDAVLQEDLAALGRVRCLAQQFLVKEAE